MSGKSKRKGGAFLLILSILLFVAGCAIMFYPQANKLWVEYKLRRDAEKFLSYVELGRYDPLTGSSHVTIPEDGDNLPDRYPELWQQMQSYNKHIYETNQAGLDDEDSYVDPSFILADYGLSSEVFAVLSIPKLDLAMPLYLGATDRHMADGAAHMTETSLPVGGINTNCVIAGHRGWNGAPYFLYINQLEKGDIVTITNLWEVLIYEVVDTKIITPYDVESIHIQPNRDLITLLTCHPPATGGRERYLVFCERIQTELEVP